MMPEHTFQAHSIGGLTSTTPSYAHLRSISFDHSYLPPTPPEMEQAERERAHTYGYGQTPRTPRRPIQDLYPIVSAWSLDEDEREDGCESDEDLDTPNSMTPMMETIFERARQNGRVLKRKLSCLTPRRDGSSSRSRSRGRRLSDDVELQEAGLDSRDGVYDPQPSSWSSSTDSNRSTYSQWEAIRLRVSIYLYWKRQALARKLSFRSS